MASFHWLVNRCRVEERGNASRNLEVALFSAMGNRATGADVFEGLSSRMRDAPGGVGLSAFWRDIGAGDSRVASFCDKKVCLAHVPGW
jgi:hypothetical protein